MKSAVLGPKTDKREWYIYIYIYNIHTHTYSARKASREARMIHAGQAPISQDGVMPSAEYVLLGDIVAQQNTRSLAV